MRQKPKEFVVYWTSRTAGRRSYSTEPFHANMKTFDDYENALELVKKLHELRSVGGEYMSRVVHHVGSFGRIDEHFNNQQGPDGHQVG